LDVAAFGRTAGRCLAGALRPFSSEATRGFGSNRKEVHACLYAYEK